MKIEVGSYFVEESKGVHREVHIALDSDDGANLFPKNWEDWSTETKFKRLSGIADIFLYQYAGTRGLRPEETVMSDIDNTIERFLT